MRVRIPSMLGRCVAKRRYCSDDTPDRSWFTHVRLPLGVWVTLVWFAGCTAAQGADAPPCGGTAAPVMIETTLDGDPCWYPVPDPSGTGTWATDPACTPPGYTAVGINGTAVVYVVLP